MSNAGAFGLPNTALAGPVFTRAYVSPDQTLTAAGALTLAHGLGAPPKIVHYALKCVTTDAAYPVGAILDLGSDLRSAYNHADGSIGGMGVRIDDAVNIVIRFNSTLNVAAPHATTGAATTLTNASWRLVVKAYA